MLIDARRLPADKIKAGVCIIGSGMGGTSVAKRLIEAGQDVLIVEAGGDRNSRRVVPPVQHQMVGKSFGLPLTRVLEIGGSTNAWHGICAPLDPIDFETRDWIAESGWPIAYSDLESHYAEARNWLGVGASHPDTTVSRPAEGPETAETQQILATKRFWTCRTPARMKNVVLRWTNTGRARCLMHAVGLELRVDECGTVRSLLAGCGDRIIEIEALVFIVAAGALETPRLLLNSDRRSGWRLGAVAALAGRYLMDHPVGYFSQAVFHEKLAKPFGEAALGRVGFIVGLGLRAELQRQFQLPNHYVFIRPGTGTAKVPNELLRSFLGARGPLDLSGRQLLSIMTNRYILQRVACEYFRVSLRTRYGDIYVMAEQVPNPNSRVALSENKIDEFGYPVACVDWRISQKEWDHFEKYFSLVAEGLRQDRRVASLRLDAIEEWPRLLSSAAHHLGTARMATTPSRGVVDADLRVFGCKNLFVCDGSVFPTSSGTNPSLTICALGLRLGAHLAKAFMPVAVQAV